jgi:hypothetical protein
VKLHMDYHLVGLHMDFQVVVDNPWVVAVVDNKLVPVVHSLVVPLQPILHPLQKIKHQ